jgi:hypothetical protein
LLLVSHAALSALRVGTIRLAQPRGQRLYHVLCDPPRLISTHSLAADFAGPGSYALAMSMAVVAKVLRRAGATA